MKSGPSYLASAFGPAFDEFQSFVRPVAEPVLSEFCTRLTTIAQSDVDKADTFPVALGRFADWIGTEPFVLCSWGDWDVQQIARDCARHGIAYPKSFKRHINLKTAFVQSFAVRTRGMADAMKYSNVRLQGTHHCGIDDARNLAKLAERMLPQLEYVGLVPAS